MPVAIVWTPELESAIIDRILAGEAISAILESIKISPQSFYRRRAQVPEFGTNITRAQEEAQEAFVDSIEALIPTIDAENFNAVKTQMWARMWIAGKRKPKKYGEKIQQEHSGSLDLSLADSISKARKRVEP